MSTTTKSPEETTVVVGMSGGVDSSVCAALLKEQGYNVVGMFMKNWEEKDENGVCQSSKEYADVIKVCEKLDIPYYSIDFVKEYWDKVFESFLEGYARGATPNPDILCNREIKFKAFFDKAMALGADFLATGHYCQNPLLGNGTGLKKGRDQGKDQTYFLYTIKSEILERVMFPIGNLEKSEVRELAKKYGLSTSEKKDSTGICFIGERNFRPFLAKYLTPKKGDFITLDGEVVGNHDGSHFYTLGQRKGLGLGGPGAPWFVVAKDTEKNQVIVERGERHPALYTTELTAGDITWVDSLGPKEFPFSCLAKNRYRQKDQECIIESSENGCLKVRFPIPQRALTPGQSVVFYTDDICLGGAFIEEVGPTFFSQGLELPEVVSV